MCRGSKHVISTHVEEHRAGRAFYKTEGVRAGNWRTVPTMPGQCMYKMRLGTKALLVGAAMRTLSFLASP